MRFAIFVHDPDGDSGDGRIVGLFTYADVADAKAEDIRRIATTDGLYVECIVLPVMPAKTSAMSVINAVFHHED